MRVPTTLLLTLLPAALAGCLLPPGQRLEPEGARAIAAARTEIGAAVGAGDMDALLRHFAPGAKLIVGRDTLDLRTAAISIYNRLGAGAVTDLWFTGSKLSGCDRWLEESRGQLGFNVAAPGAPRAHREYLYAVAWVRDSAGAALVATAALDVLRPGPTIAGCRPTAKALFESRHLSIAVQPGTGFAVSSAVGAMESALRGRSMSTISSFPGFGRSGLVTPLLAAGWLRINSRIALEAIATLSTGSSRTAAGDSATGTALGMRLDQRWATVLASARWRDIYLGFGPALVREAWHVASDSLRMDSAGTSLTHLSDAGSTRNVVGVFAQGRLTAPLSAHVFAELRAWLLVEPRTASPPGFRAPPLGITPRHSGVGVFFGMAL